MTNNEGNDRSKRTDVGYKRPPVETRFKKGQKPPARRKKVTGTRSAKELLWKVLLDPRRVVHGGRATWQTNAELVVRRAMLEAEKGSTTLQRLLTRLWLSREGTGDEQPFEMVIYD